MADSTGASNTFGKYVSRREKVERFAGTRIQLPGDRIQRVLIECGQIGSIGEVLT